LTALGSCPAVLTVVSEIPSGYGFQLLKDRTDRRLERAADAMAMRFSRLTGLRTFATMPAAVGEAERPPTVVVWEDI